jgi:hypothetical protein
MERKKKILFYASQPLYKRKSSIFGGSFEKRGEPAEL